MRRVLPKVPSWLWLLLIILVGIALRLPRSGAASLWFDEAISYLASTLPPRQILDNTVQSSHPPLYYVLLSLWRQLVPDGDTALRALSLLWNVLLIPASYLLAVSLFDRRRVGLWAALLVAVSPFHILYSHELRMYTQLMFLVVMGTWAYWEARRRAQERWWLAALLFFLAAVYTHLFAFLTLAGIGLHALGHHRERDHLLRTVLLISCVSLLFLPWLLILFDEQQQELGSLRPLAHTPNLNPAKAVIVPTFLTFGLSSEPLYSGLALFFTLALSLVWLLEVRKQGGKVPDGIHLLLLLLGTILGIPLLIYYLRPFFLPERTLAAASPFLFITWAWGTSRQGSPLPYLVPVVAVVLAGGSLLYLNTPSEKPPYGAAIRFIAERQQTGDVILHTSDGSYLPALRYVNLPRHYLLAGDPDPRKPQHVYTALGGEVRTLQQATQGGKRLWLVVALEHSIGWQEEQVRVLTEMFPEEERFNFGNIDVILFQLPRAETRAPSTESTLPHPEPYIPASWRTVAPAHVSCNKHRHSDDWLVHRPSFTVVPHRSALPTPMIEIVWPTSA